jgi:hypothetical protein
MLAAGTGYALPKDVRSEMSKLAETIRSEVVEPSKALRSELTEWTGPFDVEVDCVAVTKD